MTVRRFVQYVLHNRKTRKAALNVAVCGLILTSLLIGSNQVHVERRPGHVHVGMGSEHRQEGGEVHLGLGEGWRERLRGPLDDHDPRVVTALREEYLHPPSNQPYQVERYDQRLNYKDMESWRFLHESLMRLFAGRPPGFFVEAGALDGEYLSNTLHLEMVYGWRGLLVEPNPSSYKELLKKNRRAWSSNTCLAITPYPREMVLEMVDTHANAATSQALWVIRGSSFLSGEGGVAQKHNSRTYETTYAVVQCFPFATYLSALNITKIDLLSLDVEGAEEKILATVPWEDVRVSVLLLEHYGSSKGKDQRYVDRIEAYGFRLYDYHVDKDNIGDYIFVKK
ncbi:uncharacterized protein LOC119594311 [Penaeus monodon]|uniref:uncharacterized protein LOC119594311 n=1 Tax=Penaeus monodon TaxID=6687 RepID=UPI0018A77668|nr:uncharacterized protein LOC119594311 [Penaeus monodon]